MSRKHFVIIASILKQEEAPRHLCEAFAINFWQINNGFNKQKFMLACGFGE